MNWRCLSFPPERMVLLMLFAVAVALARPACGGELVACDVLLKNGILMDGTGGAARVGDVGFLGGKIVAVGDFDAGSPPLVIDCRGCVVCPGFIDLHNHGDSAIVSPATRADMNFLTQGCTTIVTGNCGFGPTDVRKYYDQIDAPGAGTNVAHLVPHGNVRDDVFGAANRPPTGDELDRMRSLTDAGMRDGAWGMSTGLIYVPGTYSTTDELVACAEVVATHGGIYASHMRNEGLQLLEAVNELLEIGRRAKLPVHASHFKSSGRDSWGIVQRAAEVVEQARAAGQPVTADQYPYIASSTSLEATVIPTWARAGGTKELIARFENAEAGPRLRAEIAQSVAKKDQGRDVRFARFAPRHDWVGRSLADVAAAEGQTPVEITEFVTRNGGASIVHFGINEEDVRHVMGYPWVATASDGRATLPGADRPHPRFYGTFPRKIGLYSIREGLLPLEQAVRSSTGLPADILGLADGKQYAAPKGGQEPPLPRGYLRAGMAADIVVFDPEEFIDRATFDDPHQYAAGVRFVFVNGVAALSEGRPTGALAGRALRHASRQPASQP